MAQPDNTTANIAAVEAYLKALGTGDLESAPFAENITFINPVTGEGEGAEALRSFLIGFLPAIDSVEIVRHLTSADLVATEWKVHGIFGEIPIFELFRVADGMIVSSTAYFDPRPVLGP
ncbi:MAG: nuclear transport factor 2 family protein [Blastocatellia bacterium]|nr:nuclear transport factor 2 family protein [Blastocatellia bacterium]